ncbi:hypothetical protein [Funiculus sociatus]
MKNAIAILLVGGLLTAADFHSCSTGMSLHQLAKGMHPEASA